MTRSPLFSLDRNISYHLRLFAQENALEEASILEKQSASSITENVQRLVIRLFQRIRMIWLSTAYDPKIWKQPMTGTHTSSELNLISMNHSFLNLRNSWNELPNPHLPMASEKTLTIVINAIFLKDCYLCFCTDYSEDCNISTVHLNPSRIVLTVSMSENVNIATNVSAVPHVLMSAVPRLPR